jgi:DNA-binding IscR family transcriptional regulator
LELAHPAEAINLLHVWDAVEGRLLISDCLETPDECPLDRGCPVRLRWGRIQNLVVKEFTMTTLAQLVKEAKQMANVESAPLVFSI